jgi:DNA topoisomerase-1
MNILLVESNAKCKTLLKHLGKNEWRVLPTGGHLERLAEDRKIHPRKEVKKAYWSNRPNDLPKPPWFWTERGEAAIHTIKNEASKHDSVTFYLAADPDREGERIAWHLDKLLSDVGPCHRVTFQEITKPAVLSAVASPRKINQDLVDSALIRTFIDRVVGWRASNIAKRFTTASTNSMGRVQTPTLGFIVERELEREAHVPVRYFEVSAATSLTDWRVRFHERSDAAAWVDEKSQFDPHRTADASLANSAHAALRTAGSVQVSEVTSRQTSQRPRPPFSTDALLQAAGSRWSWSPRKTSALAGQLYEAGHLTYIRTDSTRLASEAVAAGRSFITKTWGSDQQGSASAPRPVAGVQDAHEAIRPTDLARATVPDVEPDVQKLYALVRAQTLASLMVPSVRVTLSLKSACENLDRVLDGSVSWYTNPGWRRAFQAAGLDKESEMKPITVETGTTLELSIGDAEHPNPELREDETRPPARYRAYSLVKTMKDAGIGRPSTYAKTVERLEERKYVLKEEGALAPTESGRNIWLEAAPLFCMQDQREVFQTDYTAAMEALLDDVAEGRSRASTVWETILEEFKSAHAAAQEACKTASLLPRTRHKLMGYLEAAPDLEKEIGDLDAFTEQKGKEWLAELRTRGISLHPTEKQQQFLEELLETTGLTLEEAAAAAELKLAGKTPNREEASALIEYLKALQAELRAPSPKQLKWIVALAKTAGKDEAGACALVGLESYSELTGGKEGTASALIEKLKP